MFIYVDAYEQCVLDIHMIVTLGPYSTAVLSFRLTREPTVTA